MAHETEIYNTATWRYSLLKLVFYINGKVVRGVVLSTSGGALLGDRLYVSLVTATGIWVKGSHALRKLLECDVGIFSQALDKCILVATWVATIRVST